MSGVSGDVRRSVGRFRGADAGPTLLVVAAIHGNEPAGVEASRRVLARLGSERVPLRGEVACVVGNAGALAAGVRQRAKDLNRVWTSARLAALRAGGLPAPHDAEDAEFAELFHAIEEVRGAARGGITLLDVHTTSGDGPPFSLVAATSASRDFARRFPLTAVVNLLERLEGTMVAALARDPVAGMVAECGRHADPASVDRAEAVIWTGLAAAGLVDARDAPWLDGMRRLLESARGDLPPVVEVVHRHAIRPGDRFRMEPGFRHFQRVEKGRLLATDARGEVRSPEDGYILMPLYQGTGDDGFFLARNYPSSSDSGSSCAA